ncbi:hypothetical protein I549_5907 [Mycobacterium avium subsp. avium 2285 (R)]|nr:hypothetical protein I549_5907 [Mycobacterium avium subsp. avium 2285 (R)]
MTTTTRVELLRVTDGEPLLTATAMSLLLGVPVADLHDARRDDTKGTMYVPHEWIRKGRRRTKEATAHAGDDDLLSGLTYWAHQDHGAAIEIGVESRIVV